jgi:hypothetical protein
MTMRAHIRRHKLIPSALLMSAAVAAGLGISPATAHATQTLSANGSAWASDVNTAIHDAQLNAYGNLYDEAGFQPCTNVTYIYLSSYAVPGPPYGYQYTYEATGACP